MSEIITAIIIDDELRARTLLQGMLQTYVPEVNVVALCEDVPSGVKAINKLKPNLVFLDIEMPRFSGLELFDFFREDEISFEVIFVTGYSEYTLNALKLSAVDYLLKPLDVNELEQAVKRYKLRTDKTKRSLELLSQNLSGNAIGKIAVPTEDSIKLIEVDNIVYLKASSSYTEIHFRDRSKLIVSRTLKNFEEVLVGQYNFFRSHKSYLVNINLVRSFVKSDGGYLEMIDQSPVSISPDKTDEFMSLFKLIKR